MEATGSAITNFIKDSWLSYIPAGAIILIVLTSIVNSWFDRRTKFQDSRRAQLIFLDFISLYINNLSPIFENIISDIDEKPYISARNTNAFSNYLKSLNDRLTDIILITDGDLRKEIIEFIGSIQSLLNEITALEAYKNDREKMLNEVINNVDDDLEKVRLGLLNQGIKVDDNLICSYINPGETLDHLKLQYIQTIVFRMNNKKISGINERNNNLSFYKDKKSMLATKIINNQNKLSVLVSSIESYRDTVVNQRFYI